MPSSASAQACAAPPAGRPGCPKIAPGDAHGAEAETIYAKVTNGILAAPVLDAHADVSPLAAPTFRIMGNIFSSQSSVGEPRRGTEHCMEALLGSVETEWLEDKWLNRPCPTAPES